MENRWTFDDLWNRKIRTTNSVPHWLVCMLTLNMCAKVVTSTVFGCMLSHGTFLRLYSVLEYTYVTRSRKNLPQTNKIEIHTENTFSHFSIWFCHNNDIEHQPENPIPTELIFSLRHQRFHFGRINESIRSYVH